MPSVGTLVLSGHSYFDDYFRALYSANVQTSMDQGTLLLIIGIPAGADPLRSRVLARMDLERGTRASAREENPHQY
jgi:hypothetical protein